MKTVVFIFFLCVSGYSQTIVSESFSDFRRLTALNLYNPDSTSGAPLSDYGTANKDLIETGDVVYASGSPLKIGGWHSTGFSDSDYFQTAPTTHVTTPFSVSLWFRRDNATNPGRNMFLFCQRDGGTRNSWSIIYHNATQTMRFEVYISTTLYFVSWDETGSTFWNNYFDGEWHQVIGVHDGSTVEIYIDGIKSSNSTAASGNVDNFLEEELTIGRIAMLTTYSFDGDLSQMAILDTNLNAQAVREEYSLMPGWVSKNGNVTRENLAFAQTFWDTIGVPLSDATLGSNQAWKLSYKGKSSDATKTIKAWIGSAAVAKSSVYSITAGESFSTQTVNFGNAFALSSDTLWFASASTADTVSVDDVVLSKAGASGRNSNSWLKH